MLKGKFLRAAGCLLLMALSACVQTEFWDDFEDGVVNPVYRFVVGDASSVVEGEPCGDWGACLETMNNVYLFLPHIPGRPPWVTCPIRPGATMELDVLHVGAQSIVELGVVDSMENPGDFYSLKVEFDPESLGGKLTCYDEEERAPLADSLLFPVHLSLVVDETGAVQGLFTDGFSEIECPLPSEIASDSIAPAIVMWTLGEDDLAWVDNFHVELQ